MSYEGNQHKTISVQKCNMRRLVQEYLFIARDSMRKFAVRTVREYLLHGTTWENFAVRGQYKNNWYKEQYEKILLHETVRKYLLYEGNTREIIVLRKMIQDYYCVDSRKNHCVGQQNKWWKELYLGRRWFYQWKVPFWTQNIL